MADRETHRRRYKKTAAKFAKIQALFDEGAPAKDKRKMSDTWTKRSNGNPGDLHKPRQNKGRDAGCAQPATLKPSGTFKRVQHA